ncbi:hypothetical protein CWB58_19735 [Pseudoalteromonas sp. S201]|uniref:hypothetical protein n=1 Tax=unclassified Pseudoalteromonas TaxID=194690 RepID=UPI0004650019|nr:MULTISPECIES: hypothetical protein [unclassified Pseudoalteromonas]TMS90832.1 hypothetical protein CWB58_19735 [Pseudoalteromonas sp. S201]
MHINELTPSPFKDAELDKILSLTEEREYHLSQWRLVSKQREKFKWGAIISSVAVGQAIYMKDASVVAHVFNLKFGIVAGFILIFYSLFQWYTLRKNSLEIYKLTEKIYRDTEEKYGISLTTKDCVVVKSDKYSYFIELPSFKISFRRERKKNAFL